MPKISPTPGCPRSNGSLHGPEVTISTGTRNSGYRTRINAVNSTMSPNAPQRTASGPSQWGADIRPFLRLTDDAVAESFHFLQLRTELQQQKIDAHLFELADLVLHLRGRADQSRAQSAVRHGIFLNGHLLFELRSLQPLLVVRVAFGILLHIGDALDLLGHFALGIPGKRIARNPELHALESEFFAARAHIGNLGRHMVRRIAMHDVGVAFLRDEVFRSL